MDTHREAVGGMWDEIGLLQFNFMVEMGLKPHHRLLDIGCGSLRGGVHFIEYLESGNYYGMDRDADLLRAGRDIEIPKYGLDDKKVLLYANGDFNFGVLNTAFDFAIAQSLFTHLPLNSIRLCLHEAKKVLVYGGALYATFFSSGPYEDTWARPNRWTSGLVTYPDRDPYHYEPTMLMGLARGLDCEYLGDWGHPRGQRMMEYTRR